MDAMVEDRFGETLESNHRFAHEILKNYAFYVNSGPEQRLELLEAARPVEAGDGQTLLEAGYSCRDVVLVGRGRIRIYIAGENGREVTLYYVQPGESCPVNLSAAMMGIGAFADARASGDLAALTISSTDFRRISQRNAALQDYVFSATVLRFGEVIALIREITTRRVDHRLAEYPLPQFDESQSKSADCRSDPAKHCPGPGDCERGRQPSTPGTGQRRGGGATARQDHPAGPARAAPPHPPEKLCLVNLSCNILY